MKVLASLFLGFLLRFLNAYVLLWLWRWFAVPLGAPNINYWHAMGLGLFVSYAVVMGYVPRNSDEDHGLGFKFILHVIAILMLFGIGWLVHLGAPA